MNRHTWLVSVALLLALCAGLAFAEIGENFEAAGISLWGGGSLVLDLGPFLDATSDYLYWSVTVSPGFDFLLVDKLAFYVNPWLSFSRYEDYDSGYGGIVVDKTLWLGAGAGLTYYLVRDPTADTGLVAAVGGGLGVLVGPGVTDTLDGMDLPSDSLSVSAYLELVARLFWFLNDRLAPYVNLTPRLDYVAYQRDSGGTVLDFAFKERLSLGFSLTFGMSFWIPNKKAALFAKR